jgi:hypothetical protein
MTSYSLKSSIQNNTLLRANLLPKNNKNQNIHNIILTLSKRALECRMYPGQAVTYGSEKAHRNKMISLKT